MWTLLLLKTITVARACPDVELSHVAGENAKWCGHFEKPQGQTLES